MIWALPEVRRAWQARSRIATVAQSHPNKTLAWSSGSVSLIGGQERKRSWAHLIKKTKTKIVNVKIMIMRFLKLIRSRLDDDRVYRSFGASRSVFCFFCWSEWFPERPGTLFVLSYVQGFWGEFGGFSTILMYRRLAIFTGAIGKRKCSSLFSRWFDLLCVS